MYLLMIKNIHAIATFPLNCLFDQSKDLANVHLISQYS